MRDAHCQYANENVTIVSQNMLLPDHNGDTLP